MKLTERFAYDPDDTAELRAEKFAIFLVALSCSLAGCIWSAMYFVIFGATIIALLPLLFVVVVGTSLVLSHMLRNHLIAAYALVASIIYVPSVTQWAIGSAGDSGYLLVWGLCGPLVALMYFSVRQSTLWLLLYLVNIAITVALDTGSATDSAVPDGIKVLFFWMNLTFASVIVFVFSSSFVRAALRERENANRLLLNILPEKTARRLKAHPGTIAERHDNVSILFADIVDFTRYAGDRQPEEIVSTLNAIFSHFDTLAEDHRLEKIKTIGDAYMVVGGLSGPTDNHCVRIGEMALDMMAFIETFKDAGDGALALRIGIHAGPVVAGVIGRSKFAYDLWGDTVNVASRLETTARDGVIQVSDTVHEALKVQFVFEQRGTVDIRGRGPMDVYCLVGRHDDEHP